MFQDIQLKRTWRINNYGWIIIFISLQRICNCITISLSRHEQVCSMRLRFERYFSNNTPNGGRSISLNITFLNILVHALINLLYYEHWTDKPKYFYEYATVFTGSQIWIMKSVIHFIPCYLGNFKGESMLILPNHLIFLTMDEAQLTL